MNWPDKSVHIQDTVEGMARLGGRDPGHAGIVGRLAARVSRKRFGRVIEPVTIALHHRRILLSMGAFEQGLAKSHALDERTKVLAVLKSASVVGCEFCLDIGSHVARTEGVTDEEIRDLHDHRSSRRFTDFEKLVLDYSVAMTTTPVTVTDEMFAELAGHLSPEQLVELTAAIAWENYRSRGNLAFGLDAAGFSAGKACAVPLDQSARRPAPNGGTPAPATPTGAVPARACSDEARLAR